MDHGALIIALCALPFLALGYFAGALHMRHSYLSLLRNEQRNNAKLRRVLYREKKKGELAE